jgi:uncharacterized protein YggE
MQEQFFKYARAGAIVLVACAAVVYAFQYKRSIDNTYPGKTFSVDATGDIDTVPDVAKFSVSVTTEGGKNIADVQKTNTEKMNKINAYLKEQGIDAKDLKTIQYNVSPRYDYQPCQNGICPQPSISGYTISQSLDVKVRDTEKLGDLLSGVVEKGGNNVSSIQFVVDDEDAAKDGARLEAIDKAKKKAQTMAKAGGFRLGKLVSIYENSGPMPADAYGMGGGISEMSSVKSAPAPTIEPGTNTTKVQVTVTYEIID